VPQDVERFDGIVVGRSVQGLQSQQEQVGGRYGIKVIAHRCSRVVPTLELARANSMSVRYSTRSQAGNWPGPSQ
jgi:hypothetical protein